MMFPYPSAEGLHVGNVYAFTGADIFGRFQAMQGLDVFQPMGFDAFGIHSENFAIQRNVTQPATARNVARFEAQLRGLGNRFAWDQRVDTTSPDYYRWSQWIFLQLFKAGLAVRKAAPVNWCPTDRTVLADEQVIDGRCERCDTPVEQRELEHGSCASPPTPTGCGRTWTGWTGQGWSRPRSGTGSTACATG